METTNESVLKRNVKDFFEKLEKGESWVQQPSKEPSMVKNALTGKPVTGYNALVLQQALKDTNNNTKLVITDNQMKGNNEKKAEYWSDKDSKAFITTLTYNNSKAFYGANDPEVLNGNHQAHERKLDAEGKPVRDINFSMVFDATKVEEVANRPKLNEKGEEMRYKSDWVSLDENKKPMKYQEDGSYVLGNGRVVEYKKGDYIIAHHKGARIFEKQRSGNRFENVPSHEPMIEQDRAPLYKAKDESAKELLMEGLTKAFRGAVEGNYEGWHPTEAQIKTMSEAYKDNAIAFRGICNTAETRALKSKDIVARVDANVAAKEQKMVAENTQNNTKKASRAH